MARSCKSNKYGMHGHCMLGGWGGATGWVGLTRSRQLKDDRELSTSKITIVGVYSTALLRYVQCKRSPYACTMYNDMQCNYIIIPRVLVQRRAAGSLPESHAEVSLYCYYSVMTKECIAVVDTNNPLNLVLHNNSATCMLYVTQVPLAHIGIVKS